MMYFCMPPIPRGYRELPGRDCAPQGEGAQVTVAVQRAIYAQTDGGTMK